MHDLLQYALGVLHIVTLVPSSRKMIVNATLSNNRVGVAVILDAASVASSYVDPEVNMFLHHLLLSFEPSRMFALSLKFILFVDLYFADHSAST